MYLTVNKDSRMHKHIDSLSTKIVKSIQINFCKTFLKDEEKGTKPTYNIYLSIKSYDTLKRDHRDEG